jgi:hemolysin activation/secretion protein
MFKLLGIAVISFLTSTSLYAQNYSVGGGSLAPGSNRVDLYLSMGLDLDFVSFNNVNFPANSPLSMETSYHGANVTNEVGLDFYRFVQVGFGYSSITLRGSNTEHIDGDRITANTRLMFSSPLGFLELGLGFAVNRLDMYNDDNQIKYVGTGYNFVVGYNYPLSRNISWYLRFKQEYLNYRESSSTEFPDKLRGDSLGVSVGLVIWRL